MNGTQITQHKIILNINQIISNLNECFRISFDIFLDNYIGELNSVTTIDNIVVIGTNDAKKELIPITVEVFWSVAYGPLYSLLRFENEGKNFGGGPFKLTQKTTDEAFELVIKALTP